MHLTLFMIHLLPLTIELNHSFKNIKSFHKLPTIEMKLYSLLFSILFCIASGFAQNGKHLFILCGQSNIVGLKPAESFLPILESEF
jgi:hypothetical protein